MTRTSFTFAVAATLATTLAASTPLAAQKRGQAGAQNRVETSVDRSILTVPESPAEHRNRGGFTGVATIPRGHLPPRGLCRIWIDGVPPGRQAPSTDCRTALRNRPAGARVIYSDGTSYPSSWHDDRDCRVRDRYGDYVLDRKGNYRYDDDCRDDRRRRGRDDRYDRDDYCLDRDHDGRCDSRYGDVHDPRDRSRGLPEMISTILLESGRRTGEQERWLGTQRVTARYVDTDRDRVPERVTWLDAAGRVLQVWVDSSRDGRADMVELYRDGRRVRVLR